MLDWGVTDRVAEIPTGRGCDFVTVDTAIGIAQAAVLHITI